MDISKETRDGCQEPRLESPISLKRNGPLLPAKADKLRSELSVLEGDSTKNHGRSFSLNGGRRRSATKEAREGQKKSGKRAAGKADVVKLIHSVLSEDAVLEEAELKQRIEERLGLDGFSRMGFALRFKEALADPKFIDSPGGIRLAEAKASVH